MPALSINDAYTGQQNQNPPQDDSVSGSDFWQGAKSNAHELQADISALGRYVSRWTSDTPEESEKYWQAEQQSAEHQAEAAKGEMSEGGRRRLEEDITSGQFWHDLYNSPGSTIGMKLAGNAPQLLAAAVPGGVMGGVAAAAIMGAQGAGGGARAVYDAIDKMPDDELAKQSKLYAGMLETMDPETARSEYLRTMQGYAPLIEGALGAIAGYVGSPTAGRIGGGMLGRTAVGIGENAAIGGALGGTSDAATQLALQDSNQQKGFDPEQLARSIAAGAAGQAPFGVMHAFHGKGEQPEAQPQPQPKPAGAVDTSESNAQPPQQLALPPPSLENRPHADSTEAINVAPTGDEQRRQETTNVPAQQNVPAPAGEAPANPVVQRGNQPAKNYGTGNAPPPPNVKVPEAEAREKGGLGNPQNETTSRVPSDLAKDHKGSEGGVKAEQVQPGGPDEAQKLALSPADIEDIKNSMDVRRQEGPARPEDLEAQHQQQLGEQAAPEDLNERVAHAEPLDVHKGRRVLQEDRPRQTPEEAARVHEEAMAPGERLRSPGGETLQKQAEGVKVNFADKAEKAQAKSEQQKSRYENAESEEERVRASHKSPEFKESAIARIKQMRDIVEAHAPTENEAPEATVVRARAMAHAAKGVEGLDLSKPLRGAKPPASHAILKQAYRLANAKTKKVREQRLQDFLDVEGSARSGSKEHLAEAIAGQRTAGDMAYGNRQRNPETETGEASEGVRLPNSEGAVTEQRPTLESNAEESAPHRPGETGIKERPKLSKGKQKAAEIKADRAAKKAAEGEAKRKENISKGKESIDDLYEAARKGEMPIAEAKDRMEELAAKAWPKREYDPRQRAPYRQEVKRFNDLERANTAAKALERASKTEKFSRKEPMVEEASVGEKHETKEEQLETAADKFLEGKTGEAKATAEKFTPKVKAIKEKIAAKKAEPKPSRRRSTEKMPPALKAYWESKNGASAQPLRRGVRRDFKISKFERDIGEGREPSTQSDILEAGLKKTQEGPAAGEMPPPMRQALNTAVRGGEKGLTDYVAKPVEHVVDVLKNKGQRGIVNALTPNYQHGQQVKHLLSMAPDIYKTAEQMGTFSKKGTDEGHAIIVDMIHAAQKNPENFREFGRLVNDQTMRGARADYELGEGENAHLALSKEDKEALAKGKFSPEDAAMRNWGPRALHGDLKTRYQEIVGKQPELADVMKKWFDYTRDTQDDLAGEHIKQILYDKGLRGDELYQQTNSLTSRVGEARYKHIAENLGEDTVDAIKAAKKLQTGNGPYSPLNRHGDWVVHGRYKYERPKNTTASVPGEHVYEFATRKEAHDFAVANAEHEPDVHIRRYDPETGEQIKDPNDAKAAGATERFEVQIDPRHVEFHESELAAKERQEELHTTGELEKQPLVEQRREYFRNKKELTGTDIHNAVKELHKQAAFRSLKSPEERRDMEQAMVNSLRKQTGGAKVRSASLPRRNVKGADDNIIRSATVFVDQGSKARAHARYMPRIEGMLQKQRQNLEGLRYKGPHKSELDPLHTERSVAMEELDKRVHAEDPNEGTGVWGNVGRTLSTLNYIDRMARPVHLLVHQTHLPMITLPHIGGRHGFMSAYKEAARVAGAVGMKVHGKGLEDFQASVFDPLHQNANYGKFFREKINDAGVHDMYKELENAGTIHPQAGFEVERYRPSNSNTLLGKLGTHVLGRIDSAFRALTDSTEAFNRYVGATTAYRLERAKQLGLGKSAEEAHRLATDYARDTVIRTQGQYSGSNAAPLFKNRVLRPFLQFRQFPLMMYHLLAHNANKAFRGATKEEKMQGAASLLGIVGAHVAMTGLLGGLPLEIPKIMAWMSKSMGITSNDWTDFERWQYEKMVGIAGKEGADWIMHGAARHVFGADFHHRLGINSIIGTFGMPTDKYTAEKQLSFLAEFATGAPGGLAKDIVRGSNEVADGNIAKGVGYLLPFQMIRDWGRAIGGQEAGLQMTMPERIIRAAGATPTRAAETYERKDELRGMKEQYNSERNKLTKAWVNAKPDAKAAAMVAIQKFNKGLPNDAQIKMAALNSSLKSKASDNGEDTKHHLGIAIGKTTKYLADRDRRLYPQ